jgi:5-methylcytosine-specific restriction endonuclease McrA
MARFDFELNGKYYPWYRRMPVAQWREIRQYVYTRDGGKCRYCDAPVELYECHIHHVLELSEGGTNHPSNLKTLCRKCHKQRHPFMKSAREKLHEQ